jgi:hypothetical protein
LHGIHARSFLGSDGEKGGIEQGDVLLEEEAVLDVNLNIMLDMIKYFFSLICSKVRGKIVQLTAPRLSWLG